MFEVIRVVGVWDYEGPYLNSMRLFTNMEAAEVYAEELREKGDFNSVEVERAHVFSHYTKDEDLDTWNGPEEDAPIFGEPWDTNYFGNHIK